MPARERGQVSDLTPAFMPLPPCTGRCT